jgi:hypothetical protein
VVQALAFSVSISAVNRRGFSCNTLQLGVKWVGKYLADHPNSIKAAKKTFKNLFLKYSGKNPSDDTVVESAESRSGEPNSTYLAYDGFSADYLSWRYQKQKRKDTESLALDNYVKSFDHQLVGIHAPLQP